MGGRETPQKKLIKNLDEGNHLEDLRIDVRITLKRNGRLWTGFISFWTWTSGGLLSTQ